MRQSRRATKDNEGSEWKESQEELAFRGGGRNGGIDKWI